MGPPGAGKSSTWKSLAKANEYRDMKTTYVDLNPKSITTKKVQKAWPSCLHCEP